MSAATNDQYRGRVALVTGATGGIGKACCVALAELGVHVAVHYLQNEAGATELVRKIESVGSRAKAFQADLGSYEEVDAHNVD
jgi:3-oxoacyl-[acyl-carrier protein] reductase